MNILENAVDCIKSQGKNYKKYSNEWNVMQQLIDIITAQPESAEIVLQELNIEEMQFTALVASVIKQRLANPYEVMTAICEFYAIPTPEELPPEVWRMNNTSPAPAKSTEEQGFINLMDLL